VIAEPYALVGEILTTLGPSARTARTLRSRGFRFAMLVARGTWDNAPLYAKYLFEIRLGVPVALASPSTFTLYGSEMNLKNVIVIGISQSGEAWAELSGGPKPLA
jgi:glucosamine--fructose-6-phosphate aminotransferase (isomerizing)